MKSLKIGILGGGQLGKMTAMAASNMGHETFIYSNEKNSPASYVTNKCFIGDYEDEEKLKEFAKNIDIATFEFENIPSKSLDIIGSFVNVYPSKNILQITQNRLLEKNFLKNIDVEVTDFAQIITNQDLLNYLHKFSKSILKTATLGYDGKGQFVINDEAHALDIWDQILSSGLNNNGLILEKFCKFSKEISVIVARSKNSEILCYEPLENIHKNGILDKSIYPATISDICKKKSQEISTKIAKELDLVGIMAIEFFVTENENLLVNELAPRPHNSGHFSIDCSYTSQFEQLIRAIAGYPLGNPQYHSKGYMQNIIGTDINKLEEIITDHVNTKIHLYNKSEAKEGRKMGHLNIIKNNL